jgi:hypothetical protein
VLRQNFSLLTNSRHYFERWLSPKWVLVAVAGLSLFFQFALFWEFTVDDAFITFTYSRNLVESHKLVFNMGDEPVEGFSNLLWVLICALWRVLGLDMITMSKVFGAISLFVVLWLSYQLAQQLGIHGFGRCSLNLLLTCSWALVFFSVSGLETLLYTAEITLAVYLFIRRDMNLAWDSLLCLYLISITRPEGILFAVALLVYDVAVNGRPCLGKALVLGAFFIAYTGVSLWRYLYFGAWLPHTITAKLTDYSHFSVKTRLLWTVWQLADFVDDHGGIVVAAMWVPLLLFIPYRRRLRMELLLPPYLCIWGALPVLGTRDWMIGNRYLIPIVPLYLLSAILGAYQLAGWLQAPILQRTSELKRQGAISLMVLIVGLFNVKGAIQFYQERLAYPNFIMHSGDMISAAKWMAEHYPLNYSIVSWRIGALKYYSNLRIIDSYGLTDRRIANIKSENDRSAYIAQLHPELVLSRGHPWYSSEEVIEIYGDAYYLREIFPQGMEQTWLLYEREDIFCASAGSEMTKADSLPLNFGGRSAH